MERGYGNERGMSIKESPFLAFWRALDAALAGCEIPPATGECTATAWRRYVAGDDVEAIARDIKSGRLNNQPAVTDHGGNS